MVSVLLDKPFEPYGPTTIVLFIFNVAVILDSTASVQPSPSLSTSNLLGNPSVSVSNSAQLVVVPLNVTDLAFIIKSVKVVGLLFTSL